MRQTEPLQPVADSVAFLAIVRVSFGGLTQSYADLHRQFLRARDKSARVQLCDLTCDGVVLGLPVARLVHDLVQRLQHSHCSLSCSTVRQTRKRRCETRTLREADRQRFEKRGADSGHRFVRAEFQLSEAAVQNAFVGLNSVFVVLRPTRPSVRAFASQETSPQFETPWTTVAFRGSRRLT